MRAPSPSKLFSVYRLAEGGIDYSEYTAARKMLDEALTRSGRVWLIGNGGSASTASHAAHDWSQALDSLAADGTGVICLALADSTTKLTALANDGAFQDVFSRQLDRLCADSDLLVTFSVSGRSANLLRACAAAKNRGCATLSFTGPTPNPLAAESTTHVAVTSDLYGVVESAHLSVVHALADEFRPQPLRCAWAGGHA